jgi:hypothetical protein
MEFNNATGANSSAFASISRGLAAESPPEATSCVVYVVNYLEKSEKSCGSFLLKDVFRWSEQKKNKKKHTYRSSNYFIFR